MSVAVRGAFTVVPAIKPFPVMVKVRRNRKDLEVPAEVLHEGSTYYLVRLLSNAGLNEDYPMWKTGAFHLVEKRHAPKVDVPF